MNTILVVEDDSTLNKNISLALENSGYSVLSADRLERARELYEQAALILLDVTLPDGNGFAFCREIRQKVQTPVIFLTSFDEECDIVKGFDSGCDDYIPKPFRLRELLSRIRAVMRRCVVETPDLELTALEQKLLDYLMLNRGRFLTRDQILAYLWDNNGTVVNDNTLSVNISRLRDKLRESGKGQIITKRGVGYTWTDQTSS